MFRPLGTFTPTAVLTDIGLFFDKNQLHKFSLASPKANGLFKSRRMMAYKKIEICALEKNKLLLELQDSNGDDTERWIHIDTDNEDITEKLSIILSTCYSIDKFIWNVDECTEWNDFIFNEKMMELMLKIDIKDMRLSDCSISVSLPLFLKFLHLHGNILTLKRVKLPNELVSNKTLSLIYDFHILPMEGTDLVVDVNDDFLEGANTSCGISDFFTKFTIKGISAFTQKVEDWASFGILASDQMQDAIDFERAHDDYGNEICLKSNDGQKELNFCVMIGMGNSVHFSIDLNTTDTDQSGMVPIPNNLFGIMAQDSFLKFNKICSNPEELLPSSQYQMERLSIDNEDCVFRIHYTIRGEDREIHIERNDVTLKDTHKIVVEILRNCHSIDEFDWNGYRCTDDKWNYFMINEKMMELMLKIDIKDMHLSDFSISVSLPIFLKFLYRHGKILSLEVVKLPSELVSNKTLKLISHFNILPMEDTDLVVDVNDDFLEGYNTSFHISGFFTKFTIKGISAIQKDGFRTTTSFGILASDQIQDAIDFERDHPNERNVIGLLSTNGQKMLDFRVVLGIKFNVCHRTDRCVSFSIDLNTTDTDQSAMVPIPNNLFGIVAQDSFLKFNKICSNPEELLPSSQYQMERLSIHCGDCVFIHYSILGENRKIDIKRTDVNPKDAQTIVVEILRNCTSIEELILIGIKLDEDFYHLLKPIADNIHVPKWSIESTLETESLREVQAANSGLFAKIKLIFDKEGDEDEVEDMDVDVDEGLLR